MEFEVIHPCTTDETKITAKTSLGHDVDIKSLAEKVKSKHPEATSSTILGIVRWKKGLSSVSVFKNGKVIIRQAKDKAEAERFYKEVLGFLGKK